MLAPTHSIFGVFLTLIILAVFGVQWGLHWTIIMWAIFGSILPDIDHPRSVIGRIFPRISIPLERKYGHRTVTHSLVGWVVSSMIFGFLLSFGVWLLSIISSLEGGYWDLLPRWIAAFSIGYFSHLVLDMFNKRGSQMFWPDPGRDVIPRNPQFRPESGSKIEAFIFIFLLLLMFLAFPISKHGLGSSLRWLLATPGSAIQEFKSLKVHAYLEFKGVLRSTQTPVEGEAEILDADYRRLIILYKNNVYTLSDELAADILASKVRVEKTTIPLKVERREYENKSKEYLLAQIPKGALVSGVIHLPPGMDIKFPKFEGSYKTMEQKGDDLILNYATKKQLADLGLTESFEIQRRKDQAGLTKLQAEAAKLALQIQELENSGGLTPLGQELLMSKEKQAQQVQELAELKSRLDETNIRIDEVKLNIGSRKLVFSGEVYLRL
ncbi:MAG: metal-dependent hydrolase [Candidatus Margulisiibacteriota bacterium]